MENNKDVFTTIIRLKDRKGIMLPVKTSKPIDVDLFIECSKALGRIHGNIPVKVGEVICSNILNTGADIVSCKTIID
jgi:CxxC motif-containing protein